jgi:hypothetical protein
MAVKPIVFKPTLSTPTGINNYSGEVFRCFTKGDTLPFRFNFKYEDGEPIDVTGYQVFVIFADYQAAGDVTEQSQTLLEVEIPLADLETALFEGDVADDETNGLPSGLVYAMAKYVTAEGASHIIDMCLLEVYPSLTFNTL